LPFSANPRSKPFLPPHEGFHSHTDHRDHHSGGSQAFHRAHGQLTARFGGWGRIGSIVMTLTSRACAKSGVAGLLSLPGALMLEFALMVKLEIANELF
jgi:hypothetical protein